MLKLEVFTLLCLDIVFGVLTLKKTCQVKSSPGLDFLSLTHSHLGLNLTRPGENLSLVKSSPSVKMLVVDHSQQSCLHSKLQKSRVLGSVVHNNMLLLLMYFMGFKNPTMNQITQGPQHQGNFFSGKGIC